MSLGIDQDYNQSGIITKETSPYLVREIILSLPSFVVEAGGLWTQRLD